MRIPGQARILAAFVCLPVTLGLPGCSSPPPLLTFEDYEAAFDQAIEAYYVRCMQVDPSRASLLSQSSSSLLGVPPDFAQVIDSEIMAGNVVLTTACFAPLATAPCDVTDAFASISDCTQYGGQQFIPQIPPGNECRFQGECVGGYCDLGNTTRPCGTGVCSPYLTIGTACGAGMGLCDPAQASCWNGSCRQRPTAGPCQSDADCAASSTCAATPGAASPGQCVSRQSDLSPGTQCNPGQVPGGCQAGSRCLAQADGSYACTVTLSAGSACTSTTQCSGSLVCAFPQGMNNPGVCQPEGVVGSPCTDPGSICELTLYCSVASGTCMDAAALDQACEVLPQGSGQGQACVAGQCVSSGGMAATCQPLAGLGGACTVDGDCQSGVCSLSKTCVSICAPLS